MDLEIKLHLCCCLVWEPTPSVVGWVAPQAPQPVLSPTGDFPRIRYGRAVTPLPPADAAEKQATGEIVRHILTNVSKKQLCFSTYVSLSVSFFVRAGITTWLPLRNNSFGIFLEKRVIVVFTYVSCCFGFYHEEEEEGGQDEEKEDTVQEK